MCTSYSIPLVPWCFAFPFSQPSTSTPHYPTTPYVHIYLCPLTSYYSPLTHPILLFVHPLHTNSFKLLKLIVLLKPLQLFLCSLRSLFGCVLCVLGHDVLWMLMVMDYCGGSAQGCVVCVLPYSIARSINGNRARPELSILNLMYSLPCAFPRTSCVCERREGQVEEDEGERRRVRRK